MLMVTAAGQWRIGHSAGQRQTAWGSQRTASHDKRDWVEETRVSNR